MLVVERSTTHLFIDGRDELELLGGGGGHKRLAREGQLGQLLLPLQVCKLHNTTPHCPLSTSSSR